MKLCALNLDLSKGYDHSRPILSHFFLFFVMMISVNLSAFGIYLAGYCIYMYSLFDYFAALGSYLIVRTYFFVDREMSGEWIIKTAVRDTRWALFTILAATSIIIFRKALQMII